MLTSLGEMTEKQLSNLFFILVADKNKTKNKQKLHVFINTNQQSYKLTKKKTISHDRFSAPGKSAE